MHRGPASPFIQGEQGGKAGEGGHEHQQQAAAGDEAELAEPLKSCEEQCIEGRGR
jgi:hypothetical protein